MPSRCVAYRKVHCQLVKISAIPSPRVPSLGPSFVPYSRRRPTLFFIPMMGDLTHGRVPLVVPPFINRDQERHNTELAKRRVPKRSQSGPFLPLPFVIKSSLSGTHINRFPRGGARPFPLVRIYPHPHLICPFTPSVLSLSNFFSLPVPPPPPFFVSGSALTITSRPRTKERIEGCSFLFEGGD